MVKAMSYSNLFISGCDKNARWMQKWFERNFKKHNPNADLKIYDFDKEFSESAGWFKKPAAMLDAAKQANKVCWIDIDCHIKDNVEAIFDYTEPNKLCMVEDVPWSKRRGETWHNSGVVAFENNPPILKMWYDMVVQNPSVGDQEVLHEYVRQGMNRLIYIKDLPRQYNTLRLDVLDNTTPKNIKIMHWTGAKGKQEIKRLI